jgi:hypothetical protein
LETKQLDHEYIEFCKQDGLPEEYWEESEQFIKNTLGYQLYLWGERVQDIRRVFSEIVLDVITSGKKSRQEK